jgi:hypothetical protein
VAASGTGIKYVFCDVTRGRFCLGRKDKSITNDPFGVIYHQNNLNLVVYPLELNPAATLSTGDPFTQVSTSGLSLSAYVYDSSGNVLASQSSFTADSAANTLSAALNLNTGPMASYATSLTGKDIIIEFRFSNASGEITVATNRQSPFASVLKQLNTSASSPATVGETYPTTNEMNSRCVLRDGVAGEIKKWVSPDGSRQCLQYWGNDGVMHFDPI